MSHAGRAADNGGNGSAVASGPPRGAGGPGRVDCSIVIVTYNSERDVVGLLESLPAAAAGITLRTVVVDNGSRDATVDLVRAFPGVRCVETGANLGYPGGINVGREHAGEYSALLVLNPDVVLEPGALREMVAALEDRAWVSSRRCCSTPMGTGVGRCAVIRPSRGPSGTGCWAAGWAVGRAGSASWCGTRRRTAIGMPSTGR